MIGCNACKSCWSILYYTYYQYLKKDELAVRYNVRLMDDLKWRWCCESETNSSNYVISKYYDRMR